MEKTRQSEEETGRHRERQAEGEIGRNWRRQDSQRKRQGEIGEDKTVRGRDRET